MVTSTHVLADDDAARIGRVSKRKATNFVEEISAELADAKSKLGNVKGRVKATMETAVRHQTAARKHLDNDAYKRAYLTSMKAQKFVDLLTKAAATKIQMEQTAETMGTVTGTSDESSGEPASKTAAVDAVAEAEARLAAAQAKAAAVGAAKAKPPVKPSPKPLPRLLVCSRFSYKSDQGFQVQPRGAWMALCVRHSRNLRRSPPSIRLTVLYEIQVQPCPAEPIDAQSS